MIFALHALVCWSFVVLITWLVRRLIPLPPEPEGWTPERLERHRLNSERLGRALVDSLNRGVMAEGPLPLAKDRPGLRLVR